jgi:serine/threonine protein kinase
LNKEPHDEKVDIWALGCIAYEMLNSRHPFPVTSKREMRMLHALGTKPLKIGRDQDAELADLIDLMLEEDVSATPD